MHELHEERHRLGAAGESQELRRRRDHRFILIREAPLQRLEHALGRRADRRPVRLAELGRRRAKRVEHRISRHRRQRPYGLHQRRALGGRHARLAQPFHHPLDDGRIRQRGADGAHPLGHRVVLHLGQGGIQRRNDLRDRRDVLRRQQPRGQPLQFFDRRPLGFGRRRLPQRRHRAPALDIRRDHVGAEDVASPRAAYLGRWRQRSRRCRDERRGRRRGNRRRRIAGRRLRRGGRGHGRRHRAGRRPVGGHPCGPAAQDQGQATERRGVRGQAAGRDREQRQDVVGHEPRIRLDRPDPARIQQLRQLRDLGIARQQVLPVPM